MDYMITKSQILIVQIAIYDDIDRGILIPRELTEEEILRPAVFIDHHILDFKTGEEIFPVDVNCQGVIQSSIYANTMYAMETYAHPNPQDEHLLYACKIYEEFMAKQELIKQKKLIPFPQNCLFYNKQK